MRILLIALALVLSACTTAVVPQVPPTEEVGVPSPAPDGYSQFCRDAPTSPLC
jgi:hypothetical protein